VDESNKALIQTIGDDMNTNETVEITDLEASHDDDIKGGPKKIFIGGLSVAGQTDLLDLEPHGDVIGGAISGATVFSDSTVVPRQNSSAVVSLGKIGRLD
jgi:hypothetical protein